MYFTDCPSASRRCSHDDARDNGDRLGQAGGGGGADNELHDGPVAGKSESGGGFLNKLFGGGGGSKQGGSGKRSAGGGGGGGGGESGADDGAPGEMGRPVYLPKEEQSQSRVKFKLNQFNIMASDRIRLNRTLPDVRMEG